MPHALIVGYGNPLRGDDGVGWHAAERLRPLLTGSGARVLSLHQLTPELMEEIAAVDLVIFIDACTGAIAGEIHQAQVVPRSSGAAFTHHATPADLLAGAQALYGRAPAALFLTVTGADFSLSEELSPAVRAAVDDVVRLVLHSLVQKDKLP